MSSDTGQKLLVYGLSIAIFIVIFYFWTNYRFNKSNQVTAEPSQNFFRSLYAQIEGGFEEQVTETREGIDELFRESEAINVLNATSTDNTTTSTDDTPKTSEIEI